MSRSVSRSLISSVLGLRSAALLAVAVSGAGCAQSVGDIDRTQPDLIAKDNFKGEWFVRETVVDVPPTSPASFIGENGEMDTVVWDIQENYLVGYRAYELIPGIDGTGETNLAAPNSQPVTQGQGEGRDPNVYKGNPVVAYRIQSHVDIQRGYNPRTGEQNNVIQENTSDRPWNERAYMRVDWSNNDVDSFLTTPRSFWPIFGEPSTISSYVPNNEGGADAFRVDTDDNGQANYIDFTVRRTMVPSLTGCSAMFNSGIGDCTGDEVKIRTSLLKVDPEREQEYVPMVYDDKRQGEFGYFRVERPTYDRKLGDTFTGLIQLAGRHEVWEQSRDASGEPLAYSARTLRPIQYTLSEHFPDNMIDSAKELQGDYDAAFKKVVAASRNEDVATLESDLQNDTGATCLFCLDLNQDSHARNGDLRYNFLYWIDDNQAAGPLGFGPSSLNPETGRIVSGAAYIYGAQVDRYSEFAKEVVELMIGQQNGGLSPDDLMTGQYIRDAVQGELKPVDPRKATRFDGLTGEALSRATLGNSTFDRLTELGKAGTAGLAPAMPGFDQARLSRIVGTQLEAMMIPEEWTQAQARGQQMYLVERAAQIQKHAQETGAPVPDMGPAGAFSVTNWFGGDVLKEQQDLETLASNHNLWLAKFDDPAITGLARRVLAKPELTGDALYQYLRQEIFKAVALHELGHTMGLRHNFAGSADSLNYGEGYWQERVKSITPVAKYMQTTSPDLNAYLRSNCAVQGPLVDSSGNPIDGTDTTAACQEQETTGMNEHQYSSIMDYGSRFNSDIQGLGKYDIAALASGYGDLVEVFDQDAMDAAAQAGTALGVDVRSAALAANTVRTPILYEGLDNAMTFQSAAGLMMSHYSNYPALFGGYENISKRHFMPRSDYLASLDTSSKLPTAQASRVPVKVPYLACYDEFVDSVDICHRWDQGADNYEIVSSNLTSYREYYVFNNFQRDRVGFDPFQVFMRTTQRYFLPLNNMYQHWVWGQITGLGQLGTPRGQLGSWASSEGLNRLMNTMSTPEYGPHVYDATAGEYVPGPTQCPESTGDVSVPVAGEVVGQPNFVSMPGCVDIPRGIGRSFFSRYDSSNYDVFRRVLESGHFYDQMAALVAMQQSNAQVVGIGSDVQADARTFRIPYNLLFPELVENLFSSIYNQKDAAYAQHIQRGDTGAQVVPLAEFGGLTDAQASQLPVVLPGRTYTTRVQSLVAGMNLMDGFLNATYAKQGQISLLGSGEQRTAPPGFDLVQATDPATGRTFVAYREADGKGGPWYAADLLEAAQKLADTSTSPSQIAQSFADVELVRMAFNIFGQ